MRHVNLGMTNRTEETEEEDVPSLQSEDELDGYVNMTYNCVEGNSQNIDSLILNYTEKFTKRLIQEQDQSEFEALHFQHIRESPIYEILAMTYAVPKPLKEEWRAQTVTEKIRKYFHDWFDFTGVRSLQQVNVKQQAIMDKLKQNIKEIYVQNFNALQKEQQVFLEPKYRDLSILIPPNSHITLPALIHQPTSIKEYETMLYIKNNLTTIFQVPIKGVGGSGNLLVTDVKRFDDHKKIFVRSVKNFLYLLDIDFMLD